MDTMTIGAQLYIFREKYNLETEIDFVLRELAAAGYQRIEGFFKGEQNYRALLDRHRLHYAAAHLVTAELSDIEAVAGYVNAMGGRDVCVSGTRIWNERSADDYRQTADILNAAAAKLHVHGIHLHYHNHDFEFTPTDEQQTGMEILLERLDFDAVKLCLDAGWVWRIDRNPVAFLQTHAQKIGVLHLRDFQGAVSVPLGAGEIDQLPILQTIPALPNLRHLIVEQDPDSSDPLGDMQRSIRYLRDL